MRFLTLLCAAILAAQTDPETIRRLYRQYMQEKRPGDAGTLLESGVKANPSDFRLMELLAGHYSGTKQTAKLEELLERMTAQADRWPEAWRVAGDFRLRLGQFDAALATYRRGLDGDPARKLVLQKRMIEALMRQAKREEAAEINRAILQDHPGDPDARGLEASLLLDRGEKARALAQLQEVVKAAPGNPVTHYHLGRALAAAGNHEGARAEFGRALELRPDYVVARMALAQSLTSAGDYNGAIVEAREILRRDPRNTNARLIEAGALMGKKDWAAARALLQRLLEEQPNSADAHFQMGMLELAQYRYRDAEAAFRRADELNPKNSRVLTGIVETYMAQGRADEALRFLDGEIEKAPERIDLRLAAGNTAVRAGKYAEALDYFNRALAAMDRESRAAGDVYLRMGEVCRRSGDLLGAIKWLQKARAALPDNAKVLSTLALALDSAGRKQEARGVYEETVKLDPANGVALNNLAYLLTQSGGDLDAALRHAQRARDLLPNLNETADTLGWVYLQKGMLDEALAAFRDVVAKAPANPTFRYHLGAALHQKGRNAEAVKELETALASSPLREEEKKIRDLLARIQ